MIKDLIFKVGTSLGLIGILIGILGFMSVIINKILAGILITSSLMLALVFIVFLSIWAFMDIWED